jgi:DNA-binding LacI/PurR family transcriptional regulator
MRSVAERAGVSVATVSRAVNHLPTVNRKTARRIWQAISDLNYSPNKHARALVNGGSGLLGLIVPKSPDPFILELIHSFEEAAFGFGYGVLISSVGSDPEQISHAIRRMVDRNAEGLAAMIFDGPSTIMEELDRRSIPYVCIDREGRHPRGCLLQIDYFHGIRQGVQHLAILGHRRIGFASNHTQLFSTQSAVASFTKALSECGMDAQPSWIVLNQNSQKPETQDPETQDPNDRAIERLLAGKFPPTAVICSSASSAIQVMSAAARVEMKVPEDLSVIAFGDHLPAVHLPLTSILISPSEVARAAVDAIRNHGEAGTSPSRRVTIRPRLVLRSSTGFPRGSMKDLQPHVDQSW